MATKKTLHYDVNSIKVLSPRESIRQNVSMYIGNSDKEGMHQLFVEGIANAIDEAVAGFGKIITVTINTSNNMLTIEDGGRGIPFGKTDNGEDAIIEATCSLHGGGKFEGQDGYESALGLHGLGLKCIHYLSEEFHIVSYRTNGTCSLSFDANDNRKGPTVTAGNKNTGTVISFIPDTSIFKDIKWDKDVIAAKMQTYALLNNNITFKLQVDNKVAASYLYKDGIKELLYIKTAGENLVTSPVYFKTEVSNEEGKTATFDFAFCYTDKGYDREYCYANGGETPNGGTYLTGFKSGFTSLINKTAKANGIEKSFSGDMIRSGLVLIMIMHANFRLGFAEQTKLTLNSPEARALASQAISKLVLEPKQIKEILKKIETEQKIADAAARRREAQEKITKGGKNIKRFELPESLADASDFSGETELILTEGLSAMGGIVATKDKHTAVLGLRGKIKNVCGLELDEALKSDTIKDILNCLGCGVGDNFNIKNLRYDRIIIEADSDVDGGHIELLLCMMFLHLLPEIVKAGKLYSCVSPVYKVIDARKNVLYFYSEREAQKWFRTHRGFKATHIKGLNCLTHNLLNY